MKKFIILLVLFTGACVGTSIPSKFYTLNSISSVSQTLVSPKLFIGVGDISIPQYLDKPQIVVRDRNNVELNVSEFNRWSEPLGDAVQLALADDIAVYLPNATVKPTSFRQENFDYLVWVEINRFDGIWNEDAVLSAWWTVFNNNSKVIMRQKSEIKAPLGKTYDDLARQYGKMISELAEQVAIQLSKLKK